MERLHADKNKLEDRLTSLEKVQFYEETSSWLDKVDGGGGEWEESLMLGGVKGERTESDIGVCIALQFVGNDVKCVPFYRKTQIQKVQLSVVVPTHDCHMTIT